MCASSSESHLSAGETRSDTAAGGDSTIENSLNRDLPEAQSEQLTPFFAVESKQDSATGDTEDQTSVCSGMTFGDFRVEKQLGEGSMGEVYQAVQRSLNRTVALKLLPREYSGNKTLVERFLREMQSLAEIDHPNIVRILATGEQDGQHYAALEFIDGRSLHEWLVELKQLPTGDLLHIGLVCADALQQAHHQGKVHRDIKPANILISHDGICKVADFGLVKMPESDLDVTGSGAELGTPEYMAPEQTCDAGAVDSRADIYSLGIVLYVLATGELPFKGENVLEFLSAKQRGVYTRARSLNPQVPERLELILQKMLQAEPDHRYSSCQELIRDLASIGRHHPSLSFVPAKESDRFVAYGPWSNPAPEAAGRSADVPAKRHSGTTASPDISSVSGDKLWYVAHKNKLGKSVLSKTMTNDLILAIEKRLIPLNAQAKASPGERFRPLSEFDEFIPTLKKLGVKVRPKTPVSAASKSPSSAAEVAPQQKIVRRRRRKKKSEALDLVLRILFGLVACYGLVRGGIDIANLVRGPAPNAVDAEVPPVSPDSML